ncbi:unnamed protein product [Dimorphilus gyrociliatus]|uniref:Uncharacterized protein n=1 Tax=Dimorphilus gyrociliatus TaxID=2664684 RepID=A0A7I8VC65_9ANNE|nr:unnamed protein product [Dimorphilus gyrociliatus]
MVKTNKNKSKNPSQKRNGSSSKIFTLPCQVKFRIVAPPRELATDCKEGEIYAKIEGAVCDKWQESLPRILDDNSIYKGIIRRKEIEDKLAESIDSIKNGTKSDSKVKNGLKSSKRKVTKKDSHRSFSTEKNFVKNIQTTSTPRDSVHQNSTSKSEEQRVYYPTPVFKLVCKECEKHSEKIRKRGEKSVLNDNIPEKSMEISDKLANLNEKFRKLQSRADEVLKRTMSRYRSERANDSSNIEEYTKRKADSAFRHSRLEISDDGDDDDDDDEEDQEEEKEDGKEIICLSPRVLNESPLRNKTIDSITKKDTNFVGKLTSSFTKKKDKSTLKANVRSLRPSKDTEWFGLLPEESLQKNLPSTAFAPQSHGDSYDDQVIITKVPLDDKSKGNSGKYKSAKSRHPKYYVKKNIASKTKNGLALSDELLPKWAKNSQRHRSKLHEALIEESENDDLYEIAVSVSFSSDSSCQRCKWPKWASFR